MAEKKPVQDQDHDQMVIAKAKDFWTRYNKPIMIAAVAIIVLVGGWYVYQEFFRKPNENKAVEAMFKAEEYYRIDSFRLALNGDGQNVGFLSIINKYGGTKSGKLAHFYAGVSFLHLDDNNNAIKHLKKFSTGAKPIQARAYKLLGDAHADLGKNKEALDYYKKAAHHFEEDQTNSAEYLFAAAYMADRVLNDKEEAITLYKELKEKYPLTTQGREVDNYLAQLGVYNSN